MISTSFSTHQYHHFYHAENDEMNTNQSSYIDCMVFWMNETWLIDWMNVTWLIDRFSMIKIMVLMGRKSSGHHSWIKGWVMGLMKRISCGSVQEIFVLFPKFTPLCSIMALLQFSFWYSVLEPVEDTSLTNWSNLLQTSGEFLNVFPRGIILTRIEYVFLISYMFRLLNPSCWPHI